MKWAVCECFLIFIPCWKCRLRGFNGPAPKGSCTHFYTVLYGLMMFYIFYFEMLLHIGSITVLLMYQLEKAVHTVTPIKCNDASLICEFFDSESDLWCLLYLFSFLGEGRSILSELCWSLKMSDWHMGPSFSFPWSMWEFLISSADTWY